MRASSLATRLFLSATAWVVVILLITGVVLSSVYRDATERAFDRRLNLYLRTIIAEVATPDATPDQFQSLGEPLFELPLSGWYWQVTRTDTEKPEVRRSRSLWDKNLPKLEEQGADLTAAGVRLGYVDGPEGQDLRMVERPVDLGADGKFLVSVAGDASEIFDETRSFDYYLGGTFAALSIVLVLTTIFQVRFGLAPLKRISESIADIRSGRAERLEGDFPVEIAPLARETNALIDANREIVERARTHVGNLAHAIKTPLSVIVNEAAAHRADPFAAKVLEQADVMRDQVAHHLERARIAARLTIIGTVTEVAPAIEALRRTMEKIHRGRGIAIDVKVDTPGEVSRRTAGPRGNGRQPRRQRLQMGAVAGVHRGDGGTAGCSPAPARCCGSSSTMTAADCRRPSGRRSRAAGKGSTSPSRVRALGCRSWWTLRPCMAAACRSATRRSGACGRNWCCRGCDAPGRRIRPRRFQWEQAFQPRQASFLTAS